MVFVFCFQSLSPSYYDMLYCKLKFCKEDTYEHLSVSPDAEVTPDLFVLPW